MHASLCRALVLCVVVAGCKTAARHESAAAGTLSAGAGMDQASDRDASVGGMLAAGSAGHPSSESAGRAGIARDAAAEASGVGASGSRAADSGAAGASGASGAADAGARQATFALGADITWVQQDELRGATYSDGTRKDILQLLSDHGFNFIRLRTFVDPKAADGYDRVDGYGDLAHTIAFAQRIKRAGMGLLIDFHYSDNWADPGKQCVPVAWQKLSTPAALAGALHDYTKDAIGQLVAAGARPDMVQIGNEITPGMLLQRCDASGKPSGNNPVTGSTSNWTNLGMLLAAGARAVKEVDAGILVMLHIDRCDDFATSRDFIDHAMQQGVAFDVFGESCYTAYQGRPSAWQATFTQLAAEFPALKFVIAEYGPEQRAANDVIYKLPNRQGLGTFNWEPTHSGAWNSGHMLFDAAGNTYTATLDLSIYDMIKAAYADRL
jgi:arabinogalactan endo-1,4-beta-galactosidase